MERSKILDDMIRAETRLKVSALSAERRPLNLDAVLIDYDNDGFLYKGRTSKDSQENAYYIPRSAVAHMMFDIDGLQPGGVRYTVNYSGESNIQMLLRSFREQAGLTKEEVSKLTGISRSHVYNIEGGRKTSPAQVSLNMIRKVLSLYNIQPPEAVGEIEEMLRNLRDTNDTRRQGSSH